jgi:hypothetical protein
LDDVDDTPFIILEYVSGQQCESLVDFSLSQTVKTIALRDKMAGLQPPGIPSYSPSDYVQSILNTLQASESLFPFPEDDVHFLLQRFLERADSLLNLCETISDWSNTFMHGDFHEGNIVFTDEGACLLDFEYAAMGDPRVDLAYLRVQPERIHSERVMASLTRDETYNEVYKKFEPFALSFAIGWTLDKLRFLDAGSLEMNALSGHSRNQLLAYATVKLDQLETILST